MKVFISHAVQDQGIARNLSEGLRNEGFDPWLSSEKIYPGDNMAVAVADALRDSEAMVAVITPNVASRSQVQQDISFAMTSMNYSNRVIPLVIGDRAKLAKSSYPWILDRFGVVEIKSAKQLSQAIELLSEKLRSSAAELATA